MCVTEHQNGAANKMDNYKRASDRSGLWWVTVNQLAFLFVKLSKPI